MASAAGFHTFLGSAVTTSAPLVLDTGGTTNVQETYEVANYSNDAAVLVSNDGSTWHGLPPRQSMRVLTNLGAAPKIRLAGTGPVHVAPSLRDGAAPIREYQYRVKISALHSAKVV